MKKQQGAVLLITLIILMVLLVAGLALFRSTQTATQIAGNIAFKQIALPAANLSIEQALAELNTQTDFNTNIAGRYFALQQPNDSDGLPSTVNWTQVPVTQVQQYNVQHITERLCVGPLPVTSMNSQCSVGGSTINNSYKVNSPVYTSGSIYYRITVRVTGPKDTLTFVQAIIEH